MARDTLGITTPRVNINSAESGKFSTISAPLPRAKSTGHVLIKGPLNLSAFAWLALSVLRDDDDLTGKSFSITLLLFESMHNGTQITFSISDLATRLSLSTDDIAIEWHKVCKYFDFMHEHDDVYTAFMKAEV
jgi:hypothetical protein